MSEGITAASILAIKRRLEELRPGFDAIVCLPAALAWVRQGCTLLAAGAGFDRSLDGLPVYAAGDAARIVHDLKCGGKRPAVFSGPGDPEQIPDLPNLVRLLGTSPPLPGEA